MKINLNNIISSKKTLLSIAFLLTVSFASAQSLFISGKILDHNGKPIEGVLITINNDKSSKTDKVGYYKISISPDKTHTVTLEHSSFQFINDEININKKSIKKDYYMMSNQFILEEVTITTQKRLQNKIDVPIAIDVLSSKQLENLNLQELNEITAFTPGVQIEMQSVNNPSFAIRGITSDDLDPRSQPRVSVSMDGVSISKPALAASELYDMERIEVAKGPQGTLLGRAAQIGAINLIRNKPTRNTSANLTAQFGTQNQRLVNFMLNNGSEESNLANRFAFIYNKYDGFIENLSGGTLNGKNTLGFRNTTRYFLDDGGTIDLILHSQIDNAPGTAFKSGVWAPKGGDTSPYTFADLDLGRELGIKRKVYGVTMPINVNLSDNWSLSSITGFNKYDAEEKFDIDGTAAPVIMGIDKSYGDQLSQEIRFNFNNDSNFSGFIGANAFYENSKEDVTLNINEQYLYPAFVAGTMNGMFKGQLNGMLKEKAPQYADAFSGMINGMVDNIFTQTPLLIDGVPQPITNMPDVFSIVSDQLNNINFTQLIPEQYAPMVGMMIPGGVMTPEILKALLGVMAPEQLKMLEAFSGVPLNPNHSEGYSLSGETVSYDIFADGTYDITDKFKITAGIRGTYEKLTGGYYAAQSRDMSIIGQLQTGTNNLMAPVAIEWIRESKEYFSYVGRLALNYEFGESQNVYGSISRGRRPGVVYIWPGASKNLSPEIVLSYELGVKGNIMNKFSYDISAYYYDWKNFQTTSLKEVPGAIGLQQVAYDGGTAKSFGLETNVSYNIIQGVNIYGNYSLINAKFNDYDKDGNKQEYAGNTFRMTPKHSLAGGLNIDIPVSNNINIYFRPNYSYKSKVYFEDSNDETLSQKGYGVANSTLGIKLKTNTRVDYELGLFGKNVFDQKYLIDAGNSGNNIGLPTYIAGAPSMFGVILKVDLR